MASEHTVDGTAEEMPADDPATPETTEEAPVASTDLAVAQAPAGAIIRAEDPDEILAKAGKIAESLKKLIDGQNLSTPMGGGRKHVDVGGWQALGTLLGALGGQPLHAETVWTRRMVDENGRLLRTQYHVKAVRWPHGKGDGKPVEESEYDVDGYDWEACVEVRTADGVVIGRAEAMCSRAEHTWAKRDDYAVRSMAETRAESRAYRRAAGWIVHIAGYSPTPTEEMPPEAQARAAAALEASPELKQLAKNVVGYLMGGDVEATGAALRKLSEQFDGKLPAAAGQAISIIGKAARDQDKAMAAAKDGVRAAQDQAAEVPDVPASESAEDAAPADTQAAHAADVEPVEEVATNGDAEAKPEAPAPGTVATPELDPSSPAESLRRLRAAGCVCADPLGLQSERPALDDNCPLSSHGIPF